MAKRKPKASQEAQQAPPAPPQSPGHVRWMIRRDYPEVLAIERESFTNPWTEDDLLRALRNRNCIGMICENGEPIIGYMIYELHKNKLRILNFAVHPQWRRSGIGKVMIQRLIDKLSSHRRTRIEIYLRETNLPAQLFFKRHRFEALRVERGWFADTDEDAIVMAFRLPGDDTAPANRVAAYLDEN